MKFLSSAWLIYRAIAKHIYTANNKDIAHTCGERLSTTFKHAIVTAADMEHGAKGVSEPVGRHRSTRVKKPNTAVSGPEWRSP
jgi:hypothetical protein